jgi:molecular chaperone GrpE
MTFSEGAFPEEVDETGEADAGVPAGPEGAPDGANGNGAGTGQPGAPAPPPAETADPVEVLARQRDEYLLALQRTQADFENYRKRIARLQDEQSARAAAVLVSKLLPVLDTLDLAEAHLNESLDVSEDGKALRASRAMLMDILGKEGLERLDRADVPFDPSVHDAVAHTEGEGGETMVEEVFRSGYRWKGQVLRPAMVRVRG